MLVTTPHLAALPHLRHGFSTRAGGVSDGPLGSCNLALRAGEHPDRLRENWRRVVSSLDPGLDVASVAVLDQVHGAEVVEVVSPAGPLATVAVADAAWTRVPGVILAVRVADCAPILVGGPRGCAAIHAGWRGAAAGVVGRAIRALCEGTGDPPGSLVAAVGPCIGQAAFEVGTEVVAALAATGIPPEAFAREGPRGRPHVDLAGFVARQLREAGVPTVGRIDACTATEPRFYSHRRDGEATGRSAGVVAWVGP